MISEEKVKNAIKYLPINKFTISADIPTKTLKQYTQIYVKRLADIFNGSIKIGKFPDILKKAEVTPVNKNCDINGKENYCPVGTLSKVVITSNSLAQRSSIRESSFVLTKTNFRKLQRTVKRK